MATKIRLQRFGKKGKPIYHIVAADSRSKRDGRSIERIGSYNPNTIPAKIDINHARALYWVQVGAIPTDTARAILSYTGVMMKKHLLDGVKKGAHTEEKAIAKYESWLEAKANKISENHSAIEKTKADAAAKALDAEKLIRAKKEAEIKAKNTPDLTEVETKTIDSASVTKEAVTETKPSVDSALELDKAPKVETKTVDSASVTKEVITETKPSVDSPSEVEEATQAETLLAKASEEEAN